MYLLLKIDLSKQPEFKDLISDMEPGTPITLHTTLKSKDDQTAEVTVEEAERGEDKPEGEGADDAQNEAETQGREANAGAPMQGEEAADAAGGFGPT